MERWFVKLLDCRTNLLALKLLELLERDPAISSNRPSVRGEPVFELRSFRPKSMCSKFDLSTFSKTYEMESNMPATRLDCSFWQYLEASPSPAPGEW